MVVIAVVVDGVGGPGKKPRVWANGPSKAGAADGDVTIIGT